MCPGSGALGARGEGDIRSTAYIVRANAGYETVDWTVHSRRAHSLVGLESRCRKYAAAGFAVKQSVLMQYPSELRECCEARIVYRLGE